MIDEGSKMADVSLLLWESTEIVLDDSALMTHNLSPTGGFNETEVDFGPI